MFIYIDTTISKVAKVKLLGGEKVLTEKEGNDALLLISQILQEQNVKPEEIEEVRINQGPGSFTGLRVAAAIANSFNWLKNKPLITELKY